MIGVCVERVGGMLIHRREDFATESVLEAFRTPGTLLKASHKSETKRAGDLVVKRSRQRGIGALVRHTLLRGRNRHVWTAARYLESRGVSIPRAYAYIEYGRFGLCWGHAFICSYLDGYVDVEAFADGMIARGVSAVEVAGYLKWLAETVNCLSSSGAIHKDLAGKNILTRDGEQFTLIDLDAVELDCPLTGEIRLSTLVQLYDSFNDRWGDDLLRPFVAHMLPDSNDIDSWFERVKAGQKTRRARTEAIWREQGKL